jgi:hypothetical protein
MGRSSIHSRKENERARLMERDGYEKIAYQLLENPKFWFNTDRIKELTGLRWGEVNKVLDVLQDQQFISKARDRYLARVIPNEVGERSTAKVALRNIEEISKVMRFTWGDHKAVPQTTTSDRGGDGDFGVPIWFSQAGNDWVRWSEVIAGGKVITVSVSPIRGLKRSVLESAFAPSQAEIVNFTPDHDLPYAGAAKGKLWFMATIRDKPVTVTITSIRGLTERQLEDAFNSAVARITTGIPTREPAQELLTEDVRKRLPPLGATEKIKDPIIQVKFFAPWTNWTWYATEFDGEDTFFGWVVGFEKEFGYFSLSELETVRGPMGLNIERDIHFVPKPLSQVMKEHGGSLPMTIKSGRRIHFER